MSSAQRLLERAYRLIAENKTRDAAQVLDVVIEGDPHNIEAWELYMQILDSRAGLESLAERVHWNRDMSPVEKNEILGYLDYKLTRLGAGGAAEYTVRSSAPGSRSALVIIGIIFALLTVLWVSVPEIRTMAPFYFLILFLLGLAIWFWRMDQAGPLSGIRNFSYGVSTPRLADSEKPELFFQGPIIKVGPGPDEDEE